MTGRGFAPKFPRAGRLVRPARYSLCAAALAAAAAFVPATSAAAATRSSGFGQQVGGQSIGEFYAAHDGQPLWLRDGVDATKLLDYLRTADADGLDPASYHIDQLSQAMGAAWGGSPGRVREADMMLSQAFVAYVRDLKRTPQANIVWVDAELKPRIQTPFEILEAAAEAPSLDAYLADMRFMNPIYAGLRQAIARGEGGSNEHVLRLNLERARALPSGSARYIIVNAADARLTAYENGEAVDSMRVVVGKAKNPTPMMAAKIRYASLNPYWYVPPDLAAERIAPNVVKEGLPYLKAHGYQVMSSGWTDSATMVDPAAIDWKAVADGTKEVWIRQLPGPGNSMGTMKFMFPNAQGVYLHDTPQKELLTEASRLFSGGCVRLEDAARLGQWLFGKPLAATSDQAEQRVDLPVPVPVYITYLTVVPSGTELATYPDVYGRDGESLALAGAGVTATR